MVKNILKRTLSTMLVLMLVATTFFIFDPSAVFTTAEASISKTDYNPTDNVTFVVPEAIYLLPVYNAYKASTSSSFKYYVNDSNSWGVTTGENTKGYIYFYYKNTSTADISFSWQSSPGTALSSSNTITFGNSSAKGPGTAYSASSNASQAIEITAGTSPSLAAGTTGCYIQWKATFTDSVDGLSKTAYAYTYVYKPYPMPAGCALHNNNERGTNHFAGGFGFISGIHGNYSNSDAYPTVDTSHGCVTISGGGAGGSSTDASKLCGDYFTTSADNTNPGPWLSGSSSVSDQTMHYYSYSGSGTNSSEYTYVESLGGYGWIAVDSSRYTNFNQIPMLTVGLMITDDEKSSSGACYFASNRSSFAHTSNFGDYWNNGSGSGEGWFDAAYNDGFVKMGSRGNMDQGEGEGVKFNRHWSKSVSAGEHKLTVGYGNHQDSDKAFIVMNFRCYAYSWSKSDLRTAYANGIKAMARCNSTLLKSAKWTEFFNLFNAVAAQLCKIDQTGYTTVSVNGTSYDTAAKLATALTNASSNYAAQSTDYRDTFTATQVNIKVYDSSGWKYNGKFDNTTLKSWYKGAKLVFSANSYNGYTYKGQRGTTAETQGTVGSATSGTASNVTAGDYTVNHATGAVTAYFYYLRNNYTITYATDGGTAINAKSYHVESTDTLPAASGKTGYTFSTWKVTTAGGSWTSGATFNSGTSLTGKYGNVTLTAQWTANKYTVTLNKQSGTGGSDSVSATYASAMPSATMPTRTGYTFGGYYDNTGGSGTQYYTAAGGSARNWDKTAATTLYAKWTTVSYTISYDYTGGALASGQSNPTSYTIESSAITLKNPTKNGYTFKGWTGSNGTTAQTTVTIAAGSTGNKSYTANWTTVSYSITYDLANGSLASGVTNPTSYTIETNTFTLNNPSRAGYTFSGWTGSNGGTASTSVQVVKGSTGNKNFTANWSANLYTITFDANGGTAKTALNYRPTDSVTLGDTSYTGYTFVNWKVTTAGGYWEANTTHASNVSVSGKYGNATLQAQWTATKYTLSYNLDGGSVATANPSEYYITTATFTLNNPTKTGYTFAGWTGTGLGSATTTVTIAKGSTGNRSYTATWTAVNYTISYTLNSGSLASGVTNPTSYTVTTAAFTLNNPSRSGYTFKGWTGANGTTAQTSVTVTPGAGTTSGLTNVHQNLSFTANWTAKTYTVTLDQQSGSGGTTSVTATFASAMPSATMPTRTGYDFKGYYDGSSGSGTQYYTAAGASARTWNKASAATLYAYWTVHSYTISYTMNGGTNPSSNPTSYKITDSNITLADATKTGYTFTGWTGNGTTTPTKNLVLPAGSSGNKTFTANFTATPYTISYTLNGGTLASGVTNPTSYTVETAAFTLNNPSKTGYTFNGWTGANGTTAQTTVTVTPGTGTTSGLNNVRGNLSFTANFTVQSYTLTFIPNSGTFKATNGFTANSSNQTKSITYGSTYGAADSNSKTWPEIERVGYTFGGWKNGSTTYTATTTVSVTAGHSVTAQWSATRYTISINYAGGSASPANPTEYYITSDAITLTQPTRTGYNFAGYTGTGLSQATKSVTIPAGSTGNRSYTATWSTVTYIISYTMNGGTNASGNPSSYNIETPDITLADATKNGWTFNGWTGNGTTTPTKNLVLPQGSTGNKTFTANFTANKYTITFDKRSGSGGSDTVQATFGSAMPAATMPSRIGYTFGGYYTEVDGGGTQYYTNAGASARSWNIAGNRTLYAKWTINTSTLTVKPAGGTYSGSTNDTVYSAKQYNSTQAIADPTRTGYNFTGWTLGGDQNGSWNSQTSVYTFGPTANASDTLTATWSAIKYTITYNYDGGSVSTANPVEYYVTTAEFTLNQPNKTGYTFAGYTGTGLNSATKVVTIPTGSTGNREYTATWTANKVNLVFDPNGGYFTTEANGFTTGTGQTGTQSKQVTYNSTYGAEDANGKTWPNVARTGYTFQKWTSNGTSSGTTYASTGKVTITSQTTIKAYWTATNYSITCNLNNGHYNSGETNPTSYNVTTATFTLKNPVRDGYTFTGWTGSNGSNPQTTVTITKGSTTGDKTYNANWATITYNITYNLFGGSLSNNQTNPGTYNVETTTFTLKNPVKAGYAFLGWTGTGVSSPSTSVTIAKGSTGDRTYDANWQANEYTVSFDFAGGAGGTESVQAEYDADMPAITLPEYDGYTFAGYFTESAGGGTKYYNGDATSARTWNIAGNTMLYANWTATGYQITFNTDGGATVYTNNKLNYDITSTSRLVSTTKAGYTFNGWKPTANANPGNWRANTTYAGGNGTSTGHLLTGMWGNVTLKAQWIAAPFTITYDANGGDTTPADQTYYITTNITLAGVPNSNGQRPGYDFDGWMPTASVGNKWVSTNIYAGAIGNGFYGNVTLKAQWTAQSYTLTFALNGGTLTAGGGFSAGTANQSKTVTYGSTYGASADGKTWPNNPTKTGYDFAGWKNGSTTFSSGANVTITGDTTITAQWTIQSYNVTVQTANSGTATSGYGSASVASGLTNGKANYNATVTLQYTASAGYEFVNWTSSDVTMSGNSFTMPAKAVTVKANFKPTTYTISYTLNDGALPSGQTNPTSYTIETASFTLKNPEKTGYTFAGWTGSNSATTPSTTVTISASTGNKEYVANWTPKTYSVTLERGTGATGGTTGVTATFGAAMPPASKPSKNGYDFAGYFKSANGQGTKYYDENCSSAHNWDVASNYTIYAYWTVKTYNITYTLGNGALPTGVTNPTTYKITDADITLNNPERTGYTFAGWTGTGLNNATVTVTIPNGSYGDRSYQATWSIITYTITYDLAGGSVSPANPTSYTVETATIVLKQPGKGGYNFAGWTGSNGTANQTNVSIAKGSTGNKSYTAHWTPRSFTLFFEADGGEEIDPMSYKPTDTFTLGDTTREGYDFAGWKVTLAGGNWELDDVFGSDASVKDKWGDAILTAQWTIKSYVLTVDPNGGTYSGTTNPSTYTQNYNTTKDIGAASRNGYTFDGWVKISGAGTYAAYSDATTGGTFTFGAGNATIEAQWTTVTYTISYAYGVGAGSVTNPTSYTIETANFKLNNPSKSGYTFNGWTGTNLSQMSTTVWINKGSTGNRSYTANFSKNTYTVTLDRQGGTSGSTSVTATFDSAMPSATMPTRSGYTFNGYFASQNGQGIKYYNANGSSAHDWDQAANTTIYAYWTADTYTLTFNPNGGFFDSVGTETGGFETGEDKTDPQTKQVTFGSTYGAPADGKTWPAQMSRTGHTFAGWKNGSTTFTANGTVSITADTILTAQWTKKSFTLVFNMNGVGANVAPASKSLSYDTSSTYAGTPTKTDTHDAWVFRGWSENPATTSGTVPTASSTISAQIVNRWFDEVGENGTKTVYAIWQKTLKATFKDGQGTDMTSSVVIYNGAASGDVSVRTQRDFSGWTKMGWTTSTSNTATADKTSTKFTIQSSSITDTVTTIMYYGRYDRTVAVTYNANGGSTTPNPTSVTQKVNGNSISNWTNKTVTLASAITRQGYSFAGWQIGSTTYDGDATYTITGNVTAVAQWDLSNVTVTIDPNGGSVSSITYYETGTTQDDVAEATDIDDVTELTMVSGTDATIALPELNGYTFSGWEVTATNGGTLPEGGAIINSSVGESTYTVAPADATLTATWEAREYVLRYTSSRDDNWEVIGGTFAYDEDVTIENESVLERVYPGWSFDGWILSVSEDGDMYYEDDVFNLSSYDVVFDELEHDQNDNPVVYMWAEWVPANFRIAYDTNGYALSAIKSAGKKTTWRWEEYAQGDYLCKDGDGVVSLHGAYSDSTFGTGSYFYVSTTTDTRFGLGWSFDPNATEPDYEFLSDLTIDDIDDEVLKGAESMEDEEENLYELKLYMVWSANYKPLEDEVALFQRTYMTYPETGNTTLRGTRYTGANASKAVYTNAPDSARLPAVSSADNAYKSGGSEANEIWNNNSSAPDYAQYAWVAGPIGNSNAWLQLNNDDANDFTSGSLTTVNGRVRRILENVIYDPCTQFSRGKIVTQDDQQDILDYAETLNDAVTAPQNSILLTGLALKDADLDYRLSSDEMLAINSTYGTACVDDEHEGLSYRPDEETVAFMDEVFQESLDEMYPNCEFEEEERDGETVVTHHSFNSLVGEFGYANEIFALFGFDPSAPRDDDADYFMSGANLDSEGYVINPDCPYTTKSVYKLFDLIYGSLRDGTYKSVVSGGINTGNVALYYQVKDALGDDANVKLKKPSQQKLNQVVTMLSYGYHSLEMEVADYSNFLNLFQEYFDATWGVKLAEAGYTLGSNYLTSYAGYFEEESYNALSEFMQEYFSQPGVLKPSFQKRPGVEQKCIDGRPEDEGWIRAYKNEYIDESEVDISAFDFAEGTLCSDYCDMIDALVPATADYTDVFAIIANSVQRAVSGETLYMIDSRTYNTQALRNSFYPSTAAEINQGNNYNTWRTEYAKANAWTSTRANGKPAYDTEWLYRFYTKSSVDALKNVLRRIVWSYNKLDQLMINGATNGVYNDGTICKNLQNAINGLVPKEYQVEFYKGIYNEVSQDFVGKTDFYFVGNARRPYRFGMTVTYQQVADPYTQKTFNGWNTMKNTLGHHVSSSNDLFTISMALDEVLLETWLNESSAIVETENNTLYTVKLYAEWVDNVTLDIVMNGGSVQVTPTGYASFTATDTAGNHPTYDYRTKMTFATPTKDGYQFNNWVFVKGANNTASTFEGNVYTFGYGTLPKTNDTLTATWTPNTYTVTFYKNADDATGTMAPQTFQYGTAQTLTPNAFERTGWKFKNWVTSTGVEYTDEQSVSNLTKVQNGNIDLYATWEVADFTLTFKNDFTLPDWYDESLATFTWASWSGSDTVVNDLTKTITSGQLYNKADAEGKTWPTDPQITYEISGNVTVTVTFLGWFTQKDEGGTKITATSTVTASANQTVYPHFNFERAEIEKDILKVPIEFRNANEYTMESMQYVDEWLQVILADGHEVTQDDLDELQRRMNALEKVDDEDGDKPGDTTPPTVSVYENKEALQKAIADGTFLVNDQNRDDVNYMLSDDTGEVSYVFPGKAYYTYYCYTNSAQPAIMLNAKDLVGDSGRVSYPVTIAMNEDGTNPNGQFRTRSGQVLSGWMNYTDDNITNAETPRNADFHIGTNHLDNPYKNDLTYFGMNYDGAGYNHYTYDQYVLLKPTFEIGGGKQYALYTFEVKDDSVGKLATDTAVLAGAEGTTLADTAIVSSNEDVTPTNTVTIYVEYYNTMLEGRTDAGGQVVNANGTGTYNGSVLEVYNGFHENGYQNNVWVSKDFLYRNSAGIANGDFISPVRTEDGTYKGYLANDPIYGQTDVGSFYYLMKSTDPATELYWNAYDAYINNNPNDNDVYHNARVAAANAAMGAMKEQVVEDMKDPAVRAQMDGAAQQGAKVENGAYLYWPYSTSTQWSTQFYAPARTREDTLVYVHIYDRWGNTYTNILQRDLQDTQAATANVMTRGEVTINELGGSGIKNITFYELNTKKKVNVSGMTDGQTWNVVNNQFTITGLPEGANDYRYTMVITDVAGGEQTVNFQANADGTLLVTVNDENMGGKYAEAASQPQVGPSSTEPVTGSAIEAASLTVEQVTADEILLDTIPEAQTEGASVGGEEDRPSMYTFTVNDVYTVNLFADSTRDYEVTLKSTAGGTVKAYVNGEYAAPQAGKINVPSGSAVQIRLTTNMGYELQSLTMEYPDGRSIDLVGSYNAVINDDVTIKAVFVETAALLTVSVENGAVSGKQQMLVSPYSRVTAVAEAAPDGKVFAYWTQNGADNIPVSYDSIYTFIATSDITLKAIYADEAVEKTANIAMDAANPAHITLVNGKYTLAYTGRITLPEDAEIEEFGLVLTSQSGDDCTDENFRIGGSVNGTAVVKLIGQTVSDEDQVMINVNNVAGGKTRTGRLYLTVRLADGTTQTIYSNTWSELTTPEA